LVKIPETETYVTQSESTENDVEWRISAAPVDYRDAIIEMEQRVSAIRAGDALECVWLLEHPPTYTAGTSARSDDLLLPDRFPVYVTGRGGQYTYHGPGQIVGYPILDMDNFFTDIHKYLRYLEEMVILTLAEYGLKAERSKGETGVWLDVGTPFARKICALGVRASRWVTMQDRKSVV